MGRPSKLTPEIGERILEVVRAGNFREVAAHAAGIAPETLSRWMSRPREPYRSFRQAVLEAEQLAETDMVLLVRKAASGGDVKAAEWWLERKFPARWGRRDRHELSGPESGPIEVEERSAANVPLERRAEILNVLIEAGHFDAEAERRGLRIVRDSEAELGEAGE